MIELSVIDVNSVLISHSVCLTEYFGKCFFVSFLQKALPQGSLTSQGFSSLMAKVLFHYTVINS